MHAVALSFLAALSVAVSTVVAADLKIEILKVVPCDRKSTVGDEISLQYTGTFPDGEVFDTSVGSDPFSFTVGVGQVIPGFDDGSLDMCIGEQRRLTIPPELGYGDQAVGPIPANSTLIFETELIGIAGVGPPAGEEEEVGDEEEVEDLEPAVPEEVDVEY